MNAKNKNLNNRFCLIIYGFLKLEGTKKQLPKATVSQVL